MKWVARVALAATAWAVVIGLGFYVHPGWYGLALLAIPVTWPSIGREYTPEEYARLDASIARLRAERGQYAASSRDYYPGSGGTL